MRNDSEKLKDILEAITRIEKYSVHRKDFTIHRKLT